MWMCISHACIFAHIYRLSYRLHSSLSSLYFLTPSLVLISHSLTQTCIYKIQIIWESLNTMGMKWGWNIKYSSLFCNRYWIFIEYLNHNAIYTYNVIIIILIRICHIEIFILLVLK